MAEKDIQRGIKKDFEALGCYVSKYNASAITVSGHSDLIIGIPPILYGFPIVVYVEVKTKTGVLSIAQKIWHKHMEKLGFWTCVARSTQDVYDYLETKGINLGQWAKK